MNVDGEISSSRTILTALTTCLSTAIRLVSGGQSLEAFA